jgi:glutathione S-transferase
MSAYTLYFSPDSANLVVRMALEEVGATFEPRLVDRGRGELRSAGYLRLNPQGLLPVLIDGDTVLFETAAILLYLVDRYPRLGPAPGSTWRGDLYRWLFYLSNTLHAELRLRFYATRYVDEAAAAGSLRAGVASRLAAHLDLLEGQLARSGSGWLLRSGFSVVDLYLGVCCRWMALYPPGDALDPEVVESRERVVDLLGRLEGRPAVRSACAAEWIEPPYFLDPRVPRPPVGSVLG